MLKWLAFLLRIGLGVMWIIAGAVKIPDPEANVRSVRAFQLLPNALEAPFGYVQPVLEVAVGVCLLVGLLTKVNAMISALLQVAFIIGIAWVWSKGISIDCGCFGGGGETKDGISKYPWDIARDVGFMAASLVVFFVRRTPFALDNLLFKSTTRKG